MSAGGEESNPNELVIVRRRANGEEAGHKGGVWKIAYADFMTAMMTFFLVMWLINATDRKTITQVASYFNPVRLSDKTPSTKGVYDTGTEGGGQERQSGNSKKNDGAAKSDFEAEAGKPKYTEEALFKDPYGVLTILAGEAPKELRGDDGDRQQGDSRLANGEAYRDPFDPAFRREMARSKSERATNESGAHQPPPPPQEALRKAEPREPAPPKEPTAARDPDGAAKSTKEGQRRQSRTPAATQAEAAKLESEIKRAFEHALPGTLPNMDVTVTDEGLLISLTDDYDFGMFAIASAEPRPAMVAIMAKIGKILAARPERLVVRGHTDGRPYRSGNYDNWRLSTARAHMAYYMLVRGGIEEKRFERIEGHADRALRVANDPDAAQNRRIEILLRKAKPQ
ncbi:MAG: MotB family protein [Hyphomicrobiaceae bacterium]|nr:MAG: MotB family protein [Hyphomicrobiaceae bacterium]